jgi:hypothetical protein
MKRYSLLKLYEDRSGGEIIEHTSGSFVLFSEHEAALKEAVAKRDDQWATAIAKFTPFDICKMIADEISARGDK